jgi:hypothetical protein
MRMKRPGQGGVEFRDVLGNGYNPLLDRLDPHGGVGVSIDIEPVPMDDFACASSRWATHPRALCRSAALIEPITPNLVAGKPKPKPLPMKPRADEIYRPQANEDPSDDGAPFPEARLYRLARRGKMDAAEARSHIWCLERIGVRLEALVLERIEHLLKELGAGRVNYDGHEIDNRPAIEAH